MNKINHWITISKIQAKAENVNSLNEKKCTPHSNPPCSRACSMNTVFFIPVSFYDNPWLSVRNATPADTILTAG